MTATCRSTMALRYGRMSLVPTMSGTAARRLAMATPKSTSGSPPPSRYPPLTGPTKLTFTPDVPGSYHVWNCGTSFGDGHSEIHKWLTPALKIPAAYGSYQVDVYPNPGGINNADYVW